MLACLIPPPLVVAEVFGDVDDAPLEEAAGVARAGGARLLVPGPVARFSGRWMAARPAGHRRDGAGAGTSGEFLPRRSPDWPDGVTHHAHGRCDQR
jgi:hypothetical protein